jgi:hypothetical protein
MAFSYGYSIKPATSATAKPMVIIRDGQACKKMTLRGDQRKAFGFDHLKTLADALDSSALQPVSKKAKKSWNSPT